MTWPAGQAAFVTGAASGIGLGMARALVAAGAKVALADIDVERVTAAAKELADAGGTVIGVKLDVTDPDQWEAAADQAEAALGPISILCNNAGISGGKEIEKTSLEVWRWVQRINSDGPFIGVSTFLPRFQSRGGRCHIVNTASMAGIVPMQRVGAYCAAKFANFGFSMVLRDELKGTDIGVSVLCPGTVATRIAVTSGEREAELLGQSANPATIEGNFALTSQGANPDRVGDQVVEAMRKGQFMIFTHRDWEPLVTAVHSEIQRAFAECDDRHGPDVSARALAGGFNPVAE